MKRKMILYSFIFILPFSLLSLTSCSNKEKIDISNYKNEIVYADFISAKNEAKTKVLLDSYTIYDYSYDYYKSTYLEYEIIKKDIKKYDNDQIIFHVDSLYDYYIIDKEKGNNDSLKYEYEYQYQVNELNNICINLNNKTYYKSQDNLYNPRDYKEKNFILFSEIEDYLGIYSNLYSKKYYLDNDIYTIECKLNNDLVNTFNLSYPNNKVIGESLYIIQFYMSEDVNYIKTYSKSNYTFFKGLEDDIKTETGSYIKYDLNNPNLDFLDLNNYDLTYDYYGIGGRY